MLGLAGGALVVRAMRAIDDYTVEVALTLALAAAAYAGGQALHVSGPIAAVAAGLMVGDTGVRTAMSATTRRYVVGFWTLVDELLNAPALPVARPADRDPAPRDARTEPVRCRHTARPARPGSRWCCPGGPTTDSATRRRAPA